MSLDKITLHWTAGTLQPNSIELEHYHYLVNGDGLVIAGKYRPEDNINCNDGKYAAHTGGGNTNNIGVAMCGMLGYKNRDNAGKYQFTAKQVEATFKLVAQIAKQYKIPIDEKHVFTHYEFGLKHPTTTSKGKIDIIYIPPYSNVSKDEIGNFIRSKIKWYLSKM